METERSNTKKIFLFALTFLALLAILRFVDIWRAALEADVLVDEKIPDALGLIGSVAAVVVSSLAGAVTVSASAHGTKRDALLSASLFSLAVGLDRAFYIIYSIATKVKTFSDGADAYIRVISDFASYAAAFFAAVLFVRKYLGKHRHNEEIGSFCGVAAFPVVLCTVQLLYQIYNTVSFYATYDDVTPLERSVIVGDYFFIVLRYGVVTFGIVLFFVKIVTKRCFCATIK